MKWETWQKLTPVQKDLHRDNSELNKSIAQYSGCRIEATDQYGETRRFWVSQSTGWKPRTLEIKTTRSLGGALAIGNYTDIKIIKRSK